MNLIGPTFVSIMLMLLGCAGIVISIRVFSGSLYADMSVGVICLIGGILLLLGGYKLITWVYGDPIKKIKEKKKKENKLEELKTIAPLEKLKNDCKSSKEKASFIDRQGEKIYKNAHIDIKEKDWALRGGLAEGIAGVGAGVAVATKAMADNAGIREANAKSKAMYNRMANDAKTSAEKIESQYDILFENLEYIIPNCTLSSELLFSQLNFNKLKIQKEVDNKWYMNINIVNNSNYVIDGAIEASLYTKEGNKIHSEIISLPFMGSLQDYSLYFKVPNIEPYKEFTVKVTPHNLWTYEKITNKGILKLELTSLHVEKLKLINEDNFKSFYDITSKLQGTSVFNISCISKIKGDIVDKKGNPEVKKKIDFIISKDSNEIEKVLENTYFKNIYTNHERKKYCEQGTKVIFLLAPTKRLWKVKELETMLDLNSIRLTVLMDKLSNLGVCGFLNIYDKKESREIKNYYLEEEFIDELYEELSLYNT